MVLAIPAPGMGGATGIGLAAAQSGALGGGDARLQAQAAVLGGIASGALGVVAIASGTSVAVMLSGALALAAAPVGIVLSGLYLAQGGKGLGAQQYAQAMEVVGVVSSAGSLIGFTARALSGGNYQQAVAFGQGAGLAERVLAVGQPVDLAGGYEVGSLMVEGGTFIAGSVPEVRPQLPKPAPQPPKPSAPAPSRPDRSADRGNDRVSDGQRRAERMQADRDRASRPEPPRKEPIGKPGGGDVRGGGRNESKADAPKHESVGKSDVGSKRDSGMGGNWRSPF